MFDKAYLRRVFIYIAALLLAVGLAFYIGYHINRSLVREIETLCATPEQFDFTGKYESYVFRDDYVLTGGDGVAVPSVREGTKVAKNANVVSMYSGVSDREVTQLDTLRKQLHLLSFSKLEYTGGDLGISETMLELAKARKNNSLSGTEELASRLSVLIAARQSEGGSESDVALSVERKITDLLSSFGAPIQTVYTSISGWFYSDVDGYEGVFTSQAAKTVTPEILDTLAASPKASTDGAVGRIQQNCTWYAAIIVNDDEAVHFEQGRKVYAEISGFSEKVGLTVVSTAKSGDRTAVVLSTNVLPEGKAVDRRETLEISLYQLDGFRVPKSATRKIGEYTGVFTFNGVMAEFKRINITAEFDDFYVASPFEVEKPDAEEETKEEEQQEDEKYPELEANDLIITSGRELYDGMVIG